MIDLVAPALAAFVGAVLGAIGKEFLDRMFEPSRRSEAVRDAMLESCLRCLDNIAAHAIPYWLSEYEAGSRETTSAEALLMSEFKNLSGCIVQIFDYCDGQNLCLEETTALRRTCTGGQFGDGKPEKDLEKAAEIRTGVAELKRNLMVRRNKLPRRRL